ncbi:MAG TPA: alginate lyase family protein [Verrucomicrobiae bacterium]
MTLGRLKSAIDETINPYLQMNRPSQKFVAFVFNVLALASPVQAAEAASFDIVAIERPRIMVQAAEYLNAQPVTVTAAHSDRSAGGLHDFFSEGDYWWPDPQNPSGPYIQHDGLTNTNNFVAHRHAMIRFSDIVATMTSAYILTGDEKYAKQAVKHLKAWFVDEDTKMNPNLLYGQAIKGRFTGRSTGVIDTIHLVEVAQSVMLLKDSPSFPEKDYVAVRAWFRDYLTWLTTHPYGLGERDAKNNHGICWSMQAAAFAKLVGDESVLNWVRNEFKNVYLTRNMTNSGGFPAELGRTKPYGYSLFVIDAMAGIAQIASTPSDNLWTFETVDGRGMRKGLEFIFPYIADKSTWPYKHDVLFWDEWPVRSPCLLFGGVALNKPEYLAEWKKLKPDYSVDEVKRNVPLRHPLLWVGPMKPAK